jgi:hypothetical protein
MRMSQEWGYMTLFLNAHLRRADRPDVNTVSWPELGALLQTMWNGVRPSPPHSSDLLYKNQPCRVALHQSAVQSRFTQISRAESLYTNQPCRERRRCVTW